LSAFDLKNQRPMRQRLLPVVTFRNVELRNIGVVPVWFAVKIVVKIYLFM